MYMLSFGSSDDTRTLLDEEVLLRARAEPWLFAVLLDRYQDAFLRKAVGIIHDPRDAEEIVQDTLTKTLPLQPEKTIRHVGKFS